MRPSHADLDAQPSRARQLLPSAFFAVVGILWLFLAWVRHDMASSFAHDANITVWAALTDASAVARSANVEAGVAALQKLTEAILSGFTGILFFASAFMFAIPVLRRAHKREAISGEAAAAG